MQARWRSRVRQARARLREGTMATDACEHQCAATACRRDLRQAGCVLAVARSHAERRRESNARVTSRPTTRPSPGPAEQEHRRRQRGGEVGEGEQNRSAWQATSARQSHMRPWR
eukprot:3182564-Alexandrium_andersonii.AAC.1